VSLLSAYWVCGDLDFLASLFEAAGMEITATRTRLATVRFDSVDEAVRTEIESTPLIERISEDVYRRILEDSRETFRTYISENGKLEAPIEGHLITAKKR